MLIKNNNNKKNGDEVTSNKTEQPEAEKKLTDLTKKANFGKNCMVFSQVECILQAIMVIIIC